MGNCTEQVYDAGTNVSSKIDGEGNVTLYYYDVLDRLVKVSYPKISENGVYTEEEISSYIYNEEGNIKEQKNGSKNITEFEYTASGDAKKNQRRKVGNIFMTPTEGFQRKLIKTAPKLFIHIILRGLPKKKRR